MVEGLNGAPKKVSSYSVICNPSVHQEPSDIIIQ